MPGPVEMASKNAADRNIRKFPPVVTSALQTIAWINAG
jgi:hypothetical protein